MSKKRYLIKLTEKQILEILNALDISAADVITPKHARYTQSVEKSVEKQWNEQKGDVIHIRKTK